MLDTLHEDSNRILQKPDVEALDDSWVHKNDLPGVGTEAWRRLVYGRVPSLQYCYQ